MSTRRKSRKPKTPCLKIGNVYCIDYWDHFEASRSLADSTETLRPVLIRSIGTLVAITPLQYNLEYGTNLTAEPVLSSIHGIMRSCIVRTHDLGPAPKETP